MIRTQFPATNDASQSPEGSDGHCYDVVGVGFGPANIALAVALAEHGFDGSVLMCEAQHSVQWQPDMLLPGSDIQNNPHRDLVTPVNPRSRYSFLNFLHEHGMLLEHLNLGIEFPLRAEYARYVKWVASFFSHWVQYGARITTIAQQGGSARFCLRTASGEVFQARSVVVAPGRTPLVPGVFATVRGPRVFHSTRYLSGMQAIESRGPLQHVCVIGSSQSAAEIVVDLIRRRPGLRVTNVMRGFGYRLKDTSPFSERAFLPEFVDYYHACSAQARTRLDQSLQFTNYSAVDGDVIRALYLHIYEEKLAGRSRIGILNNYNVISCDVAADGHVFLQLEEVNTGRRQSLTEVDAVVLATGFRNLGTGPQQEHIPPLLAGLEEDLSFDERGAACIGRDYRLLGRRPGLLGPIYLNGLCESTHGFGDAGSFSLLSIRAREICESLLRAVGYTARTVPALVARGAP